MPLPPVTFLAQDARKRALNALLLITRNLQPRGRRVFKYPPPSLRALPPLFGNSRRVKQACKTKCTPRAYFPQIQTLPVLCRSRHHETMAPRNSALSKQNEICEGALRQAGLPAWPRSAHEFLSLRFTRRACLLGRDKTRAAEHGEFSSFRPGTDRTASKQAPRVRSRSAQTKAVSGKPLTRTRATSRGASRFACFFFLFCFFV